MVNIPLFSRVYTFQVVRDFFHQQYEYRFRGFGFNLQPFSFGTAGVLVAFCINVVIPAPWDWTEDIWSETEVFTLQQPVIYLKPHTYPMRFLEYQNSYWVCKWNLKRINHPACKTDLNLAWSAFKPQKPKSCAATSGPLVAVAFVYSSFQLMPTGCQNGLKSIVQICLP